MTFQDEVTKIDRQYGKGTIVQLGGRPVEKVRVISTGSLALDLALGAGGLPRGRVTELYGVESGGKTTLALHCVAEAQKAGGNAAYIDSEHALDPEYAKDIGVDTDSMWVCQPDYGEQGLEICERLIKSGGVDIVVVDSVASLCPKAVVDGEMGDQFMGLMGRMMSQALQKLTPVVSKSNTCLIFVNQLREKLGIVFGNPEVTPGGRSLKFYSSVRLDVRRGTPIKVDEETVGSRTKVKVTKNKVGPPFKTAEFDLIFGKGISKEGEMIDLGTENGQIEKSGSWLTLFGERFQGRDNAIQALRENKEMAARLEAEIRGKLGQ